MDWKSFFLGIESSWPSVWVREAPTMLAFPTIIALHAIGMGLLVGANIAMDLRVLGFAPRVPLAVLETLFPVLWFGFWLNAVSGVLLLLAYPTKALTNPLFYAKLALIGLALAVALVIRKRILDKPKLEDAPVSAPVPMPVPTKGKLLAGVSLALWAAAIIAGRVLAYTYTHLTASDFW